MCRDKNRISDRRVDAAGTKVRQNVSWRYLDGGRAALLRGRADTRCSQQSHEWNLRAFPDFRSGTVEYRPVPIFLDRHDLSGQTAAAIAEAHRKDLEVRDSTAFVSDILVRRIARYGLLPD